MIGLFVARTGGSFGPMKGYGCKTLSVLGLFFAEDFMYSRLQERREAEAVFVGWAMKQRWAEVDDQRSGRKAYHS